MANQIERPSLTTSLEERYKQSDKAKLPTVGNYVDRANEFSKNFAKGAQQGVTHLTDKALNYSDQLGVKKNAPRQVQGQTRYSSAALNHADKLGVSTKKYKG